MSNYHSLSLELQDKIRENREKHWVNPYAFRDEDVVRRYGDHEETNLWRPTFVRDIERILHNPYYNRYSDKTQVLSAYRNDDISRRALHVQLVARIAKNIGQTLGLNTDLIEAISLGHDIGHTPFGHAGERFLNEIYHGYTGRYFNHNVQSVRVLDKLVCWNISLQVLDGALCHNGEMEMKEYRPVELQSFDEFDARVEACYTDPNANKKQIPSTLEGCVMRISDIIAYLGKDRQDAQKVGIISEGNVFSEGIGRNNAEIINNMVVNIIENSYGNDYISMDEQYFEALSQAKKENYEKIYRIPEVDSVYQYIGPMFEKMYDKLLVQAKERDTSSILFEHHMNYPPGNKRQLEEYMEENPHQIVVDYMASMTDNYFVALYQHLFPNETCDIPYIGYFQEKAK